MFEACDKSDKSDNRRLKLQRKRHLPTLNSMGMYFSFFGVALPCLL